MDQEDLSGVMRWGGMGILRCWIRWTVWVSAAGGKRGRPSGSTVVISVSVVGGLVDGKGFDDGVGEFSVGRELEGFDVISKSSSSGRGIVSAKSRMSSSGRR